jgi:glycerol uptake operon antiterminator
MMGANVFVKNNPIIAAVRDASLIEKAVLSPVETIFLMTGDIFSIEHCVDVSRKKLMKGPPDF